MADTKGNWCLIHNIKLAQGKQCEACADPKAWAKRLEKTRKK